MKRRFSTLACVIIVALLCFVSCKDISSVPVGTLNVIISDSTTRTIYPDISMDAEKYEVTLLDSKGTTLVSKELDKSNLHFSQSNIPVGLYTVQVDAKNKEGIIIGSGSKECEVKVDETTDVSITVIELSGTGKLSITLTGDIDSKKTYTLTVFNPDDTVVDSVEFFEAETLLKVEIELDNGFYYYIVTDSEGNSSTPEAFRIVKGNNLEVELFFVTEDNGSLLLTIINSIRPNPSLRLQIFVSQIYVGEKFTLRAIGMSGKDLEYRWYLNGKEIEGDGDLVTLCLESAGDYEIRCLVIDTTSSVVCSVKETITSIDSESSDGKTTITVLNYLDYTEPDSANEVRKVWEKFSELHPEINVIREDYYGEQFHEKLNDYILKGNLPDVIYAWPNGRSTTLHNEGLIKDLTPFLEADGIFDDYAPTTT
ncbi:MAG: hypothetical protein ACI4SL_08640, partial [Candidatus Ornithospirochaeta sp.]